MMRVAGRSENGFAKAIQTDEDGNLIVKQVGKNAEVLDVKVDWTKSDTVKPTAIFSKNGFIYVGKENGEIIKYDENGIEQWAYLNNPKPVNCLFVDDNNHVYVGLNFRSIIKLDSNGLELWVTPLTQFHSSDEGMASVYQKGEYVYFGPRYLRTDTHVIKVDKTTGEIVYFIPIGEVGSWEIPTIAVDDSENIYVGTRLNYITKLSQIGVIEGVVNTDGTTVTRVSGAKFVTDGSWTGKTIYVGGDRYTIESVTNDSSLVIASSAGIKNNVIFAQGALTKLWACVAHGARPVQIKLGAGNIFYTSSRDNKVRKWDQTGKTGTWGSGESIWSFDKHTNYVVGIDVDSQGNVYSCSLDKTVRKIDGNDGSEIFNFVGHSDGVVGMTSYEHFIYTISNDKTFKKITNEQQFIGYRGI